MIEINLSARYGVFIQMLDMKIARNRIDGYCVTEFSNQVPPPSSDIEVLASERPASFAYADNRIADILCTHQTKKAHCRRMETSVSSTFRHFRAGQEERVARRSISGMK
jgi:hypothetical protein